MAFTYYENIEEAQRIEELDDSWKGEFRDAFSPYLYKEDIEILLNQQFFNSTGEKLPIKSFQVLPVKFPVKNGSPVNGLILVALVNVDGDSVRITGKSPYYYCNNTELKGFKDKMGNPVKLQPDKPLCLLFCRPQNPFGRIFLKKDQLTIDQNIIPVVKIR